MFKRIVPLVVALALLVPCLLVSASAADTDDVLNPESGYLDYNDFITDVKVDGDNDLITCYIPLRFSRIYLTDKVNERLSISANGTGYLEGTIKPESKEHAFYFSTIALNGNRLACRDIPDGSTISFDYDFFIDADCPAYSSPKATAYIYYYDIDGNFIGEQHDFLGVVTVGDIDTASITIDKYPGAASMAFFLYVWNIVFIDNPTYMNIKAQMWPTKIEMSIASIHRLEQSSDKTNELLSALDKQLEKNGQKLNEIINMQVNPRPPDGSGSVSDVGKKEDMLLQDGAAGREEFNNMLGSAAGSLEYYTGSFGFLTACFTPLVSNIPWIREILTISLGLGTTGFLLNLGISALSKHSKDGDKSSGKGGGKRG